MHPVEDEVFDLRRWLLALLSRIVFYVAHDESCREYMDLVGVEIHEEALRLFYTAEWGEGVFGLEVSSHTVLPSVGYTSTSDDRAPIVDSELDAVAFDIAVLLLGRPFRADGAVSDERGVKWLDISMWD